MKTSSQITLGELIARVEPIVAKQREVIEKYEDEAYVCFDFEYAYPTDLISWRGSYAELSLTFTFPDHSDKNTEPLTVTAFLELLKGAIGKTYTGYKGGEFVMGRQTPIWVANYGNSGETAVIGVIDNEYSVILETARCEY